MARSKKATHNPQFTIQNSAFFFHNPTYHPSLLRSPCQETKCSSQGSGVWSQQDARRAGTRLGAPRMSGSRPSCARTSFAGSGSLEIQKKPRPAREPGTGLAPPVLGSLCASRKGIPGAAGMRACESRAERAGEATGRLGVVELQQFCFEQGDGGGAPHADRRRAVAAGASGMRKARGQDLLTVAIRLYSLKRSANFSIEPESLC